ncbi:HD-like signal output (HDOD) protein [Janthinobacterium sp. CG_23.3]|uniref:HDOD domain-containing protein n=1 Tax=unclassified Janthinobacterium TaxID=2610881 RepID=UPI00047645E7|nr:MULTISPECIES: HDOD domain-containing protein [unclassified Janthinobacterium]MEC5159017.1 HD-like signal output (HDOD) protein [Janthinobacterium sp. CG_S6]
MTRLEAFGIIVAQATRGELVFPTSVNAALQLQLALADPECHIDTAIKLVLADPALAARTVALANSAVFNRGGGAGFTGVRAAVLRVGYRNLYSLVAAMVVRQFGSKIVDPNLRIMAQQLWEHTAHVAALAHVIARRVTFIDADTALFAGIVHEVGGFYLLSRADEFPGLLQGKPERWMESAEEVISHEVMKRLMIPDAVAAAVEGVRDGLLAIPPDSLLDTLLLAKQLAPVASPLQASSLEMLTPSESVIGFIIDNEMLKSILEESDEEVKSMCAALLV